MLLSDIGDIWERNMRCWRLSRRDYLCTVLCLAPEWSGLHKWGSPKGPGSFLFSDVGCHLRLFGTSITKNSWPTSMNHVQTWTWWMLKWWFYQRLTFALSETHISLIGEWILFCRCIRLVHLFYPIERILCLCILGKDCKWTCLRTHTLFRHGPQKYLET